jgi:hypothetical protein
LAELNKINLWSVDDLFLANGSISKMLSLAFPFLYILFGPKVLVDWTEMGHKHFFLHNIKNDGDK